MSKLTEFDLLIESAYHEMSILSEGRMTAPQRKKVADMGKDGWNIDNQNDGKVYMSKNGKTMHVTSSGSTVALSESKQEVDVTDLMEALNDESFILTEGLVQNFVGKFKRTKPKLKIYTNGIDGVLCVAETQGVYSVYHTVSRKIIAEKDNLDKEAALEYAKQYEEKGYRRVSNRARLIALAGLVGGVGAIAIGAGTMAAIGVRLVFGLLTIREEARAVDTQAVSVDIAEAKQTVIANIDRSISTSGGEIYVDIVQLEKPVSGEVAGNAFGNVMDVLMTPLFWGAGFVSAAVAAVTTNLINPLSDYASTTVADLGW